MPGNVQPAAPTAVLPLSLCKAFQRSLTVQVIDNAYKSGESQRSAKVGSARSSWQLTKRLAASQMGALRSFFLSQQGQLRGFYFYDVYESNFSYDPAGTSTLGRYIVRFAGNWNQTTGLGRGDCSLALIEIA